MDIPKIGTPLGSMLVLCVLWLWTLRKGRAHVFQQEVLLREQNRSTSMTFIAILGLACLSIFSPFPTWLLSSLSFIIFIAFAVSNKLESESFWSKRRNIFVAGFLLANLFGLAPYLFIDRVFIPLIAGLLVAHVAHTKFLSLFSSNLRDLEALQAKLLKHDSERQNKPIFDGKNDSELEYRERIGTIA